MEKIPGYHITDTLYESQRTVIYRASRTQDNTPVILKVLNREYPSPEEFASFKREFGITRNLHLEGVITPYKLEKHGNSMVMSLEDFEGISLAKVLVSRRFPLEEFLKLALRITSILGEIHQHQVIHKDLNPSNIIWNPETDQLKIIDFGISTLVSHDQPSILNPNVLEGTIAYMSPEQTGRMNREIDYRTDFYSLGVTLYEMLLGFLPFQTTDTMELIHCHLAKSPRAPHELNPDIPKPVSQIIMKLMAKTAEDRYQSIRGIVSDLRKCHEQLTFTGQIQFVAVGQDDVSERFQFPQKLYGRSEHYHTLLKAFDRVSKGRRECILVSGYAGMGKSALVHEIYEPVIARRGYFVAVKFDQVKQDIPYLPLIQALQALIQQILTESESHIAQWKETFLSVVEENGQVLITLMPALTTIIGKQPPVPELPPEESQNRLYLVLGRFLQAFIAPEHPLVLFLDDLEWADAASLKLVQFLLTAPDIKHLLVIGTYQEMEMGDSHPLQQALEELQQAEAKLTRITLTPLSVDELARFLAETFQCAPKDTASLAQLMFEKTYGNPFAVKEFLKTLHRQELLTFDSSSGKWQWNPEQIQGMALTENVVRFMTLRIQQLPENIQELLRFAACIGTRFDLHTLAQARNVPEAETAAALEVAIAEGLIVPADDAYNYVRYLNAEELKEFAPQVSYDFVHNRIREAADALSPESQRAEFHLNIGRHLLRCDIHKDTIEENITDIVTHLNMGTNLLKTKAERVKLAQLNLLVGKRAKALADYTQALKYLTAGVALMKKKGWQGEHYRLTFDLHKEQTEVECLCGDFEQAAAAIHTMLEKVHSDIERAAVLHLQVMLYTFQAQHNEAIRVGKEALRLVGFAFPEEDELEAELASDVAEIRKLLKVKPIATLLHEPELTLPEAKIAVQLLDKLILATFQSNQQLYYLIVAKLVNLSLKYGHTSEAAYGFAQYGAILGARWGFYKAGYEFGKFAVKLSEKSNNPAQKCKALCALAAELSPWVRHVQYTNDIENEAYQVGVYAGEFQFAGLALMYKIINWFYAGVNLRQILSNFPKFLHFVQRTNNLAATDALTGYRLVIQNMCGLTADMFSFDTDETKEAQFLTDCQKHQSVVAVCLYRILKAQLLYLYGKPAESLHCLAQAEEHLDLLSSVIARAEHNFYASLSLAARIPDVSKKERKTCWEQLQKNQEQMKIWAENCPENFQQRYLLIQAEEARLREDPFAAMQLYKQAIQAAKDHDFPNIKALAHELAARCYVEYDFEEFARLHLMKAHGNYTIWGATRKVEQLAETYSKFFTRSAAEFSRPGQEKTTQQSTETLLPTTEQGISLLDLQTVLKASQAFSGEIVLAELLQRMMRIVIENAGAQNGWLLLEKEGNWTIEAEGVADSQEVKVLHSIPVIAEESGGETPIPSTIIQYVIRTGESVVLNNAGQEGNFTTDPCIVKHQTKSVLCTPLIKQGKLIGILYLENNLAPGAFTADRLEVLNMLSSQMAISIENATLYKELEEALTQQIDLSNRQVELTNAYSRFVPSEFLSLLGKKSITDVQLGDQIEKEITVMFCDIRGFTPLSETMTPQQNFNFINSYLSQMSPIIRKHHGFIDKYIGDAIMALFPTHADDAVRAAIAMLKRLVKYNQGRKRAGYPMVSIGIGLNTGDIMLGTVGDQARMDGTVISDAVNLASRIEGMTKVYGVSLLIGETTYFQLQDPARYAIRIIDQVQAKGKSEPVTVFEVFDGDPPEIIDMKQQTLVLFKQGFKLYHQAKFAGATSLFSDVLQVNPEAQMKQIEEAKEFFQEILHVNSNDKVAQIYVQRCENIQQYGISNEWKGVWAWIESLRNRGI